jgi:hypothetical protein
MIERKRDAEMISSVVDGGGEVEVESIGEEVKE